MNSLCKVKGFHVAPHIRPILPQLWPSAGHRTPCLAARTIQGEAGGKIADMSDSDIEVSEELNRDNLRVVLFSARPYVSEHFQPLCQTFPRAEFIGEDP